MNSIDSLNNFKYLAKIAIILLIVFLILKYVINLRPYEAILLAAIIAVSVLIIENILFINNQASDPLNCDQCKVEKVKEPIKQNFAMSVSTQPPSMSSMPSIPISSKPSQPPVSSSPSPIEKFGVFDDLAKDIKNVTKSVLGADNKDGFAKVENFESTSDIDVEQSSAEQSDVVSNESATLDSYIDEQAEKNIALLQNKSVQETNKPTELPANEPISSTQIDNSVEPADSSNPSNIPRLEKDIKAEYKALLTNQNKDFIDNTIPSMNLNDLTVPNTVTSGDPIKGPSVSFDENYVQYQKNGLEKLDQLDTLKTNLFRASIGNQDLVKGYLKDGEKYYNDIYSYSTDAPKTYEALNSELKYGNYNYIGPINKGMINKAYTFISPSNWYPINPFPPVCVTNKSCTTCPIQITDGKDYMNFASLEDFDKARRFTGDMQINIDYIKNVLNNPNAY
jgi:hypothetical protein